MWKRLIIIALAIVLPVNVALAADQTDVVVTATGVVTQPPVGFTVYYISDYEVGILWDKPASANNTMIRTSYNGYPETREDGYLLYYGQGTSYSDNAVDLNETFSYVYYRAWTEDLDGSWSPEYVEDSIRNEAVTELAEGVVQAASILQLACIGAIVLALTIIAFWRRDFFLYVIATLALVFYGLYFTDTHMAVGIMICVMGAYSGWKAIDNLVGER